MAYRAREGNEMKIEKFPQPKPGEREGEFDYMIWKSVSVVNDEFARMSRAGKCNVALVTTKVTEWRDKFNQNQENIDQARDLGQMSESEYARLSAKNATARRSVSRIFTACKCSCRDDVPEDGRKRRTGY